MQFIDLQTQYQNHKDKIDQRIHRVLQHGRFIKGPEINELEEKLADYTKVKHCIGVSSGTDALLISLMALGVGPGDEVITTPFSFFATAETIILLGAIPVFVDIDPYTYNIAADLIAAAITPRTKVIMPVSLYGQCADMDKINAVAKQYGLSVIEDAAQSFGAMYKDKYSCHLSTISCTSFYPSKPLGCYGDGGACFTDDENLARKMREIRDHGQDRTYHHVGLGINGRLDTLQAAVLLAKLELFPLENEMRLAVAEHYNRLLSDHIPVPFIAPYNKSVYALYTIKASKRDALQKYLQSHNIPTAIHYPMPLYEQPIFKKLIPQSQHLPLVEQAATQVLSLPIHPYLPVSQIEFVAKRVIEFMVEHQDKNLLETLSN
jgi:UDP-2-acetamido-2-deoxy-ribo-hexuluronate aminotransferase